MSPLLEIEKLDVGFGLPGTLLSRITGQGQPLLRVLENVSLTLAAGETLGLVGESGSGKTTLARAITGLTPSQGGIVRLGGREVNGKNDKAFQWLRREIAMMFQGSCGIFEPAHAGWPPDHRALHH